MAYWRKSATHALVVVAVLCFVIVVCIGAFMLKWPGLLTALWYKAVHPESLAELGSSRVSSGAVVINYYEAVKKRLEEGRSYPRSVGDVLEIVEEIDLVQIGEQQSSSRFWYVVGLQTNDPQSSVLFVVPPRMYSQKDSCAFILRRNSSGAEEGVVWTWHRVSASWLFGTREGRELDTMRGRVKLFCGTNEVPIDWSR